MRLHPPLHALQHQNQAGDPTVNGLMQLPDDLLGPDFLGLQRHDPDRLLQGQAQVIPAKHIHQSIGPQPGQGGRRVLAADDDDLDPVGYRADPLLITS